MALLNRIANAAALRYLACGSLCRLALLLVLAMLTAPSFVQAQPTREYQVKAAFLYNFAKFVEWPSRSPQTDEGPMVIGVLGTDTFGEALDSLRDKSVMGRRVVVRKLIHIEEAKGCHVLFISSSERGRLAAILRAVRDQPVLTVADMEGFCHGGGIINMVSQRNKIGFEINAAAAQRAGLKISSHLLRLAKTVLE